MLLIKLGYDEQDSDSTQESLKEIWNAKILFLLEESASRVSFGFITVVYKQGYYYGVQKDLGKARQLLVGAAKQGHMRSLEMLVNQSAWTPE